MAMPTGSFVAGKPMRIWFVRKSKSSERPRPLTPQTPLPPRGEGEQDSPPLAPPWGPDWAEVRGALRRRGTPMRMLRHLLRLMMCGVIVSVALSSVWGQDKDPEDYRRFFKAPETAMEFW